MKSSGLMDEILDDKLTLLIIFFAGTFTWLFGLVKVFGVSLQAIPMKHSPSFDPIGLCILLGASILFVLAFWLAWRK